MASSSAPDLLVSDADRDRVVAALRDHAAAGRLDPVELEARVEAALTARTVGELEVTLADLPPVAVARRRRAGFRAPTLGSPLGVALALVVIWAATGAGAFWPMWPLIGLGVWSMKGGCGTRRPRPAVGPLPRSTPGR